jgi:D-alanyl-D-alanine carboxypeptidase
MATVLVGCGASHTGDPRSARAPSQTASQPPSHSASQTGASTASPTEDDPAPGTVPPPWLGTRVLPRTPSGYGEVGPTPRALRERRFTLPDTLPPLPGTGYAARVTDPAPRRVLRRSTWRPSCPVAAPDLAWVRLAFWGFDDRRHTGELLVDRTVADDIAEVFGRLYRDRFPLEAVVIESRADLAAPPTGDGNPTTAFVCRAVTGGTSYSQHAYGLAVDVNSFQNPYHSGGLVLPELSGSYLDRDRVRPGMILPGGPVVRAFRGIGWSWGGDWHSLKDYQHFSRNGL